LEADVNDLAYSRNIVIHGADYVTSKFASRHGRLGRSWGCPALDPALNRDVIETIRDRTALFAYYPDERWLASSPFLRCDEVPSRGASVRVAQRGSLAPGARSVLEPVVTLIGR
ncbi:MAG: murein L,D-transpeptidase catalytic domain-containing protein, partial [Candidatus Binatia bacterium]